MKIALALLAALPLAALAAAAGPLKVTKTVEIKAPADKVWAAVKDFDSLNKWHPGFSADKIVKGTNNKPGAVRSLTDQGWADLHGGTAVLRRSEAHLQVPHHRIAAAAARLRLLDHAHAERQGHDGRHLGRRLPPQEPVGDASRW